MDDGSLNIGLGEVSAQRTSEETESSCPTRMVNLFNLTYSHTSVNSLAAWDLHNGKRIEAPWARKIKGGHYDHIHISIP